MRVTRARVCVDAKRLLVFVSLALASTAWAQDSVAPAYRVAGTITLSDDKAITLIESSAGTQHVYRLGEYIDDWQVIDINSDGVALANAGQRLWLPLKGKLTALGNGVSDSVGIKASSEAINFGKAFTKLQALESKPKMGNARLSYADINNVLGLSAVTRIREIDGEAVASPFAVLQLTMVALATERPFRLSLSESKWDELYLTPSELFTELRNDDDNKERTQL